MSREVPAGFDVVELLRELVCIPSVNPHGDPGTDAGNTGERRCAEFVADRLAALGATVELRDVLPGRPNVLARFPTDRPGKGAVLFAPHTDTVSVAGMTVEPFAGEVREGRLWGRGATDTKGTLAAMLAAFATLGDDLPRLGREIWFAGLMGEEAGNEGAPTPSPPTRTGAGPRLPSSENPPAATSSARTRVPSGCGCAPSAARSTERTRSVGKTPFTRWPTCSGPCATS